MRRREPSELFDLFWENSKLNAVNMREFGERIDEYYAADRQAGSLMYPGPDHPLALPNDALLRTMRGRKSVRVFSSRPVSMKRAGSLFAAFARSTSGSRLFASAGSTYAIEVFCIFNAVQGALNRMIVSYNADNHSLSVVGHAPVPEELAALIHLDTAGTLPAMTFIFVLMAQRTTDKYGERGGRFALIELGHAVQNLALRVVHEGMAGVEVGGYMDDRLLQLLSLDRQAAKIALVYICGH